MCHVNIIHFSHHHEISHPAETPNTNSSTITTTSTTYNNCNLSNPNRLTRQEELISHQRLPQHRFVRCPTHTNHRCVVYKQTMPCLLQRFHSSPAAAPAAAAPAAPAAPTTTTPAEVNTNVNASPAEHEGGMINVSTCPNLQLTSEHHPLRLLLDNTTTTTTTNNVNINNSENGESMPGGDGVQQRSQTLSQAKTTLLSTANELHQQTIKLNTHILETCSLLEFLFQKLAAHTHTHTHTNSTHTHTQAMTLQRHQPAQHQPAPFNIFKELEIPLQHATELCQEINQADAKITDLFKTFLQRRKEMVDLLTSMAALQQGGLNNGAYPYTTSKARQDLRELSTGNIREVCEEPMRREWEVVREVVRVLEGVEGMLHMGV